MMTTPPLNSIVCGDAAEVLRRYDAPFVDCIVTSPPYYQQRIYGNEREVGREESPQDYVTRLVEIFAACHHVLHREGSMWVVIGDKYDKGDLLGMPWRLALALKDNGWILRSECIWHKPNAMPSSTKTRLTTDHETVFFFTKSKKYYYDADAIREPHVTFSENSRMKGGRNHFGKPGGTPEAGKNGGNHNLHRGRWDQAFHPAGRNKRTVWSIALSKFRGAHFSVFPEPLVETCIKAGCPPQGVVLDPFCGSGTTCVVARRLGRGYLGTDCVKDYCEMAETRLAAAGEEHSKGSPKGRQPQLWEEV